MPSLSPTSAAYPTNTATQRGTEYKHYDPSLAAAVVMIIVFGLLTVTHLACLIQTRKWFCTMAAVGGCFEIVGFICRTAGSSNPYVKPPFIIQALTILLAPMLFAATAYSFLGRLIQATGRQRFSIVRHTWLAKIFVGGDIICFLIQAGGGGMLASANNANMEKVGNDIILGGLWLQIFIIAAYVVNAVVFDVRMRKHQVANVECHHPPWKKYMYTLYGVSILITSRNVYRAVEYTQGRDGYLMTNEWPTYVFDAFPMTLVLALMVFWYSADLSLKTSEKQFGIINETHHSKENHGETV